MDAIVSSFASGLSGVIPAELIVFLISLLPILELRGGLIAAVLLGVPIQVAIPVCIIGNILPIPFILLFIKRILKWLSHFRLFKGFVSWLEERAMKRSEKVSRFEFWGLALFVGIPIPGTGAWTGSLISALLNMSFKKSIFAELLGIAMATVIMSLISYGLIGKLIGAA